MTSRLAARWITLALLALLVPSIHGQQPAFRTGVELIRLDVTVVNDKGEPVTGLTPADFEVTVRGEPRPVVSAQFLSAADEVGGAGEEEEASGGFSSNLDGSGRLITILVDEGGLANMTGTEKALFEGLDAFVASLRPNDRVALISIPGRSARVDFTNDFASVREAVSRLRAFPIATVTRERIQLERNEGGPPTGERFPSSRDALTIGSQFESMVDTLCAIADYLKPVEGPKTLVLVSGNLPGGTGELSVSQRYARCAAEARMKLYAIRHLSVEAAGAQSGTGSNQGADAPLSALHQLAGLSGGAVFDGIARAEGVFERIDRETAASYVLGIEPPAAIARDKPLEVKVQVKRPGLMVRSRTQVLLPTPGKTDPDPMKAVQAALQQPRPATTIGIRIASYAVRGPSAGEMKTVVEAEFPTLYAGDAAAWGWEVRDGAKPITNAFDRVTFAAPPASLGAAVNLAPGRYTMRLAVATPDGRIGSVEHPLVVESHGTPAVGVSDLFVGDAVQGRFQPRVSIRRGTEDLVAFLELYPASEDVAGLQVDFEMDGPQGPAGAPVPGSLSGSGAKRTVQARLPLEGLDPGRYTVTATVSAGGETVATVRREVLLDR